MVIAHMITKPKLRELHSQMIDEMHTEQEEAEARLKIKNEKRKRPCQTESKSGCASGNC